MDWDCCGTSFHLRSVRREAGTAPRKEIVLWLRQGCPGRIPLEAMVSTDQLVVQAKLCEVGSTQCEDATSAKLRLEMVSRNGKHASGSFTADFPSAGHQEAKFAVKYHHTGPRVICE